MLRIVTANTDWGLRGDADYIGHLCANADVVLTQESKDTDLAAVVPAGWTALQDTTDKAHMGTGILVRDATVKVVDHELTLGVRPILRTGRRVKMLSRYINSARLIEIANQQPYPVSSAHFPPKRFSVLQPLFLKRLAAVVKRHPHSIVGTDANQPIGNVAKALGCAAHGQGIVGILTRAAVQVGAVTVSAWGENHHLTDHPSVTAECSSMILAPRPYALTTRDGHTIDQLTNYALYAMEQRLGYIPGSLTVVQGSYNSGDKRVRASAGTHDGGGAVDLTPENWEEKVRAARAVGFAAWHRPAIPDLWEEHIHCILIGNAKLSAQAAAQVVDYREHRDGLAGNGPDLTWHPNPIPVFHMPKYAQV